MNKIEENKQRVRKILGKLEKVYPAIQCPLKHSNPWELLVATILSAQCTDKRVNLVTPALFAKYRTIRDYAQACSGELEKLIQSTGFYRSKAKNIQGAAEAILRKYDGKVPDRMEDLVELPGVGRKTANVLLGHAFDTPGLSVDTHMIRLNGLLGFTRHRSPVKIEHDLMEIVPVKKWTLYSDLIIRHGRVRCVARRPECARCEIKVYCPSAKK